jgi:hypothetical protein
MPRKPKSTRWILFWRAVIEIAGIIFLFYSNLLMGEFNARAGAGKTWSAAFEDIFTRKNMMIAVLTATVGFAVWEMFRKWLEDAGKNRD